MGEDLKAKFDDVAEEVKKKMSDIKNDADDYFEIFRDAGLEWHEEEIKCDFCKHKFNVNRTFKFLYDTNKIE